MSTADFLHLVNTLSLYEALPHRPLVIHASPDTPLIDTLTAFLPAEATASGPHIIEVLGNSYDNILTNNSILVPNGIGVHFQAGAQRNIIDPNNRLAGCKVTVVPASGCWWARAPRPRGGLYLRDETDRRAAGRRAHPLNPDRRLFSMHA